MNAAGIFMMVLSYTVVLALTAFCVFRVLTTPGIEDREHAPLDIDTHDKNNRS